MIWLHVIHPQTLSSDHVIAQWAKEIYMYYADLNTQYDALLHWIVSTHGVLSWPVTPQLSDNV